MIKIIIIENTKYRKCSSCRETKELNLENFIRRNTENGWRGRCRICYNKNIRKNQELNNTEKARYKKYRLKAKATKPFYYLFSSCKGNAKKGHTFMRAAEKIYHYASRILVRANRLKE